MSDTNPGEPLRRHPDELMRWAHSAPPQASLQGIRYDREMRVAAKVCQAPKCGSSLVHHRFVQGKGANKRALAEPRAVCGSCGRDWTYEIQSAPATAINDDSGRPWDYELQMAGVLRSGLLKGLAARLLRSRAHRWEARLYVKFVMDFANVRAQGGVRALLKWASGQWPHAPFQWSDKTVRARVAKGRELWAAKLQTAKIIEEGDWWREPESEHSSEI